jgi:hypothetical protein
MIAPIREAEPPPRAKPRRTSDVRRLVASLFLDDDRAQQRPAASVVRWKAWLLVVWAVAITIVYFASMLDLF